MASFGQWQRAGCQAKRITWVCGPEQALASDVIASICSALPGAVPAVYFAGTDIERDIWDACGVVPPAGQERLVAVHEAQKLRRPGELVPLVKAGREAADLRLLFVSAEDDFTRVPGQSGEGKGSLAPHLAAIRDARCGQLIRCTPPKDDDLLDWVTRQWPGLGRNAAHRLLELASWDLPAVRAAGAKARACGLLDEKYIPVLCEPPPGGQFAELLIQGDRAGALAAARSGPVPPGPAIGLLDSRLGALAAIREGQRRQLADRDIAARMGVPRFLIGKYRNVAHEYGPSRVRSCRELLAIADAAWRTGAAAGVAEVLAANW